MIQSLKISEMDRNRDGRRASIVGSNGFNRRRHITNSLRDSPVYTGLMGAAFMCLRSYEVTGNHDDLQLYAKIIDACATTGFNSNR